MTQTRKTRAQLIAELEALRSEMKMPDKRLGRLSENIHSTSDFFRTVTDNMLDAMVIIDWEGIILYANISALNLADLEDTQDISGLNIFSFIHPDSLIKAKEDLYLAKQGAISCASIYKIISSDGTEKWVETFGKRTTFQGINADLINIRDISERMASEQKLRESEERFRALHNASFGGIGIHEKGFIIECNQGLADMTGYPIDELIGMFGLELIAPAWREHVMEKILSGYEKAYDVEGIHKDGTIYPLEIIGKNIPYHGRSVRVTEFRDITARKQTEDALRDSEERYRRITSAITDYIFRVYVEDGIAVQTVHSPACEAVTGYTLEEFASDSFLWLSMVVEQDVDDVCNHASQVLSNKDPGAIEHRIRHKDGSIRWISNTPVLHRDPSGKLTSYDGVIKDITQRKQAQEALKESEEKYHSLFSNNHAVMLLINPASGRIMDANPAACSYYGYSFEELLSMKISDINTLGLKQVSKKMKMAHTGQTRRFEFQHRLAGGEVRDVEVYSGPITVGGEELLYSIIHDVTDRKRAEEALKQSEDRFRSLIQNSSDMIVILDGSGSFIYETPSVKRVLGYKDGYLVGKKPRDLIHLDDIEVIADSLDEVYSDTNKGTPSEFRVRKADGSWVYLEAVGKNLLDFPGINGIVITARDITSRKKMEKDRIEMEKRFLHAQKLESLGVMAGGIAHDFNNLLMAILGNLDLALIDLSPVSRSRRFIDQALLAGRRAADLTNQMLAYSGRGRFDLKSFDISELVEEMARLLKASISKTVSLNLQMKRDLPLIMADPSQIQQIIMNLIVNASEAIGDQPGIVTVSTCIRQCDDIYLLQSRLREKPEAGTFVFLEVADTGCGMDQDTLDKLFDPFFTTKFTGRGLGMAAVLGIVRGHNGAIMVDSEHGKGTTISVLLPCSGKPEIPLWNDRKATSPKAAKAIKLPLPSETILVVDDEEMVLDLCKSMLEQFGYHVFTASDGEAALALFRKHKHKIDCVILDLTMPKKDGMSTFDELRGISKDIKVIISSGYDEKEVNKHFSGKDISGIIKKPFHIERLREELQNVLKG